MALTANRNVDHYVDQELRTLALADNVYVFRGALLGLSPTGYARPLVAGDRFVGLAYEETDNIGGAAGDLSVRVYTRGDFELPLPGATFPDIGRPVFASADDTLTFAAAGNSCVGIVQDVLDAGEIILRLDTTQRPVKTITYEVADLSAGQDVAARAIHSFGVEGWIVAARVVNESTAAAGIDASNTCVVQLATGAGVVATKTFDNTTPFPAANASTSMGTISNAHAPAGTVLTLAVTNGSTANPGPFHVCVDYV
ncbi:MAG: hypothetical protein J5J06_12225 [Phycisphaerae bacterium]|nr:hypothetical protein [Phycisphaerae bacterium]